MEDKEESRCEPNDLVSQKKRIFLSCLSIAANSPTGRRSSSTGLRYPSGMCVLGSVAGKLFHEYCLPYVAGAAAATLTSVRVTLGEAVIPLNGP